MRSKNVPELCCGFTTVAEACDELFAGVTIGRSGPGHHGQSCPCEAFPAKLRSSITPLHHH
jgi:hypothetical protein